jgi:hypothetical protein
MKLLIILMCSTLLVLMYSCNKSANTVNKVVVKGKWNIISDSTYTGVDSANYARKSPKFLSPGGVFGGRLL